MNKILLMAASAEFEQPPEPGFVKTILRPELGFLSQDIGDQSYSIEVCGFSRYLPTDWHPDVDEITGRFGSVSYEGDLLYLFSDGAAEIQTNLKEFFWGDIKFTDTSSDIVAMNQLSIAMENAYYEGGTIELWIPKAVENPNPDLLVRAVLTPGATTEGSKTTCGYSKALAIGALSVNTTKVSEISVVNSGQSIWTYHSDSTVDIGMLADSGIVRPLDGDAYEGKSPVVEALSGKKPIVVWVPDANRA